MIYRYDISDICISELNHIIINASNKHDIVDGFGQILSVLFSFSTNVLELHLVPEKTEFSKNPL